MSHALDASLRLIGLDVRKAIRHLTQPHLTREDIMAALDRLNAVHTALQGVPAQIDATVAAGVAEAEAALDPVITDIEADQAAITAKLAPAAVEPVPVDPAQ